MTTLSSILLAFVLESLVSSVARIGIPRTVSALLAVVLMMALAGGLTYFFYSRAVDFATQLPRYSSKTRCFMLTWKDHVHSTTVRLSPKEHRLITYRTVGRITTMIRGFIAGNVLVGLVGALVSTVVFWRLGVPYFYFLREAPL